MRQKAFRPIIVMLSIMLAVAVPAHAGNVTIADVSQVITTGPDHQVNINLRLETLSQSSSSSVWTNPAIAASNNQNASRSNLQIGTASTSLSYSQQVHTTRATTDITPVQGGSAKVEVIDLGEISGTVCDCGEIPVASKRGFPKWPLLALAVVPLFFIGGGNDSHTPPARSSSPLLPPSGGSIPVSLPSPDPTPSPAPVPVPEPATLFLFGTSLLALGAGARRRRNSIHAKRSGEEMMKEV